ncbi:MAG: hypothetical protein H7145_08255 [Akkermansiaceae bacterium]|nr:hypothetical protein [Armatimonadota bacterium]
MPRLFPSFVAVLALGGGATLGVAPAHAQTGASKPSEKTAKTPERMMELFGPAIELAKKDQFKEAVAAIDKVLEANPEYASDIAVGRFDFLLKYDEDAAQKYALKVAATDFKGKANTLNAMAWAIVEPESKVKKPDYAAAVTLAEASVASSKLKAPWLFDTLVYAYEKAGDLDKAIATGEKVIALYPPDSKSEFLPSFVARVAALKKLRAAAPAK